MIINIKKWKKYEEINKNDALGKCCVDVAREIMKMLDDNNLPLKNGYYPDLQTAHGLICQSDENINAGGITKFMANYITEIIYQCHSRGEEFKQSYNWEIVI